MIARRGTLALLTRELRVQARAGRTYVLRGVLAGLILTVLTFTYIGSARSGAPGLALFGWVIFTNLAMVTLAAASYFATVITEEREQQTLGLLRMTDLNGISILLGKSATRVTTTITLLLVQFPFILLAITLGGVGVDQVVAAYAVLLAYTVGVGGVGLLLSILCRRSRNASAAMVLALLAFFIVPPAGLGLVALLVNNRTLADGGLIASVAQACLEPVYAASPLGRLWEIFSVGIMAGGPGPRAAITFDIVWTYQVRTNAAAGLACFALAWLAFEYLHRDELPDAPGGAKSPSKRRLARRRRSSRRAWNAALVWKDFQYIGGGVAGLIKRVVFYVVLVVAVSVLMGQFDPVSIEQLGGIMLVTALIGIMLECALQAGHVFRDEIRWQTLSSIMILPTSVPRLAYAKIAGCLLSLIPAAALFCVGALLATEDLYRFVDEAVDEPWAWATLSIAVFFLHLVVFLSLYVKRGALALALGIMLIGYVGSAAVIGMFFMVIGGPAGFNAIGVFVLLVLCGLTVVLHILSGRRLGQLAGL